MTVREQALLNRLRDAWADIRSYHSGLWQVTGICLAVIGLTFSVLSGTLPDGVTPMFFSIGGLGLMLFAVVIVSFTQLMILVLKENSMSRSNLIGNIEDELNVSDFPVENHSRGITGNIVMFDIYYVILVLGLIISAITGWQLYTLLLPFLIEIISLVLAGILSGFIIVLMILSYLALWRHPEYQ